MNKSITFTEKKGLKQNRNHCRWQYIISYIIIFTHLHLSIPITIQTHTGQLNFLPLLIMPIVLWSSCWFWPTVFSLVLTYLIILNQCRTAGRTHLDHVRLSLSVLLTNLFGFLSGNKLNSTTPKTSLMGRGAMLVTTGSTWHITSSISGTGIGVHKVPYLHWIRQHQCNDQTVWPHMIHNLMRVNCENGMIGSSLCVYVVSCFILEWQKSHTLYTVCLPTNPLWKQKTLPSSSCCANPLASCFTEDHVQP